MNFNSRPVVGAVEFHTQLLSFFEAYLLLSDQLRKAVEEKRSEFVIRFIELRQETIGRLESFREEYELSMQPAVTDVEFQTVESLKMKIGEIIERCLDIENGLNEQMKDLRESLGDSASQLGRSQRGIRGYAINGGPRKARFIDKDG